MYYLVVYLMSLLFFGSQALAGANLREDVLEAYLQSGVLNMSIGQSIGDAGDIEPAYKDLAQLLDAYKLEKIIRPVPNTQPGDTLLVTPSGDTLVTLDLSRMVVFLFPASTPLNDVVDDLFVTEGVRLVERVPIYNLHTIPPDDNLYGDQWYLAHSSAPSGSRDINAEDGWGITTGSTASPSLIGIFDTGVSHSHIELLGKVSGHSETNFHGTAVAGLISAHTDNSFGVASVNWTSNIFSRHTSDYASALIYSYIVEAISAGVEVINCSWGSPDAYSTQMRAGFKLANEAGITITASMGNEYELDNDLNFPAGFADVVAVGATDDLDEHA